METYPEHGHEGKGEWSGLKQTISAEGLSRPGTVPGEIDR